ncbi:unnamed protein product [Clavelina lepadiformis]|uniref:Uncharacterized protein n=1 Tax=Clavelina lepadiformis TaxID=159417 RepID=A0ABP0GL02_CLALP
MRWFRFRAKPRPSILERDKTRCYDNGSVSVLGPPFARVQSSGNNRFLLEFETANPRNINYRELSLYLADASSHDPTANQATLPGQRSEAGIDQDRLDGVKCRFVIYTS